MDPDGVYTRQHLSSLRAASRDAHRRRKRVEWLTTRDRERARAEEADAIAAALLAGSADSAAVTIFRDVTRHCRESAARPPLRRRTKQPRSLLLLSGASIARHLPMWCCEPGFVAWLSSASPDVKRVMQLSCASSTAGGIPRTIAPLLVCSGMVRCTLSNAVALLNEDVALLAREPTVLAATLGDNIVTEEGEDWEALLASEVDGDAASAVFAASRFSALTSLDISRCPRLTSNITRVLAPHWTQLCELRLDETFNSSVCGGAALFHAVAHRARALRRLSLRGCTWLGDDILSKRFLSLPAPWPEGCDATSAVEDGDDSLAYVPRCAVETRVDAFRCLAKLDVRATRSTKGGARQFCVEVLPLGCECRVTGADSVHAGLSFE